jgi:hypothetical protein
MWHKQPRATRAMQEQQGRRICLVRWPGHDEIFHGVGSGLPRRPITWIMNNGKEYTNPLPTRYRTTRPDLVGIRGKVESCTRSPNPTRLVQS